MGSRKQTTEKVNLVIGDSLSYTTPKKSQGVLKSSGQDTWYYLGLVGDIGFKIAIPIAGGAILGQYIDRLWNFYPRATLSLLLVGIIISLVGFIHTVLELAKGKRRN